MPGFQGRPRRVEQRHPGSSPTGSRRRRGRACPVDPVRRCQRVIERLIHHRGASCRWCARRRDRRQVRRRTMSTELLHRLQNTTSRFAGWAFVARPTGRHRWSSSLVPIIDGCCWVSLRDWNGITPPVRVELRRAGQLPASCSLEPGIPQTRLRSLPAQQPVLRARRGPAADRRSPSSWRWCSTSKLLKGRGLLPHGLLLPVDHRRRSPISLIFIFLFAALRRPSTALLELVLLPIDSINWLENANGLIHNVASVCSGSTSRHSGVRSTTACIGRQRGGSGCRRPERHALRDHDPGHVDHDRHDDAATSSPGCRAIPGDVLEEASSRSTAPRRSQHFFRGGGGGGGGGHRSR